MPAYLQAFIFVFGVVIGSFLNAALWRMRTRESVLKGRSYCPKCRHQLAAADLIPLLSFLILRGRCRYCSLPISPSYFMIEAVTGLLFLLVALVSFPAGAAAMTAPALAKLILGWFAGCVLLMVFVYDFRYMLIPRSLTLPAAVLVFLANAALGLDLLWLAMGAVIGGGFFWLQRLISRGKWVGGGDVNLGLLMGALLGYPMILVAFFLAYISGAFVGVILMALRRKSMKSELPFGTFLSAAAIITMLYGQPILEWYLGYL